MTHLDTPTAVLLASGGLDSTTLAYWLENKGIPFIPLFVNYGQHSHQTELAALREVLPRYSSKHLAVVDISSVYQGSSSRMIVEPDLWQERVQDEDLFLPQRNLVLLSVGAAFAQTRGISDLFAAFIETDKAPGSDCCNAFFALLEPLLRQTGNVTVQLPFRTMSKRQVAKLGSDLGAPIGKTFSCLAAASMPCGACPNCVDRLQAIDSLFEQNEPS